MADRSDLLVTHVDGPAPEMAVSRDIIKRGVIVAPVLIALCGVIWGSDGAISAAYGIVIVLANFALAAALVTVTAKISIGVMMGAVLFGYLLRLGLIFLAVWLVQDAAWISFPALGATIIVTHLGLLMWELKYVSLSLAYPGLKPTDSPATDSTNSTTSSTSTTLTHD